MVAITVTLAAVVGAFVMGVGDELIQPAPQVTMEVADADEKVDFIGDDDDRTANGEKVLQIEHRGGDKLQLKNLKIVLKKDGGPKYVDTDLTLSGFEEGPNDEGGDLKYSSTYIAYPTDQSFNKSADFTVGETLVVQEARSADAELPDGEYEITIIHKPSNSIVDSATISIK
ncbi:type IV pilin [Halospeciosus flavus]|uniref:Type IV pilin n=1 Tax=Halospeciosus flavus TaxID=3032283 RepID=A0ABD5Z968_9EURY